MAARGRGAFHGIPKNGTVVPSRIFVGGIPSSTNEDDLVKLFSKFGTVKGTKIVFDKEGRASGYGFVTFETEDEAQQIIERFKTERLILKDRKLNVAPAVKKQPNNRADETNSATVSVVWPTQPYPRATPGFAREPMYYPQVSWPVWPQFCLDQQCHFTSSPQVGFSPYAYPVSVDFPYPPPSSIGLDYSEMLAVDSGGSDKIFPIPTTTLQSDYPLPVQTKASDGLSTNAHKFNNGSSEKSGSYVNPPYPHLHSVFTKTPDGVTVMAYSSSVMNNSTAMQVKGVNSVLHNMSSEYGIMHSVVPATLTPPPTPLVPLPCNFHY